MRARMLRPCLAHPRVGLHERDVRVIIQWMAAVRVTAHNLHATAQIDSRNAYAVQSHGPRAHHNFPLLPLLGHDKVHIRCCTCHGPRSHATRREKAKGLGRKLHARVSVNAHRRCADLKGTCRWRSTVGSKGRTVYPFNHT